jgi:hypothetical protein
MIPSGLPDDFSRTPWCNPFFLSFSRNWIQVFWAFKLLSNPADHSSPRKILKSPASVLLHVRDRQDLSLLHIPGVCAEKQKPDGESPEKPRIFPITTPSPIFSPCCRPTKRKMSSFNIFAFQSIEAMFQKVMTNLRTIENNCSVNSQQKKQ